MDEKYAHKLRCPASIKFKWQDTVYKGRVDREFGFTQNATLWERHVRKRMSLASKYILNSAAAYVLVLSKPKGFMIRLLFALLDLNSAAEVAK
jgi:hypothetical protein